MIWGPLVSLLLASYVAATAACVGSFALGKVADSVDDIGIQEEDRPGTGLGGPLLASPESPDLDPDLRDLLGIGSPSPSRGSNRVPQLVPLNTPTQVETNTEHLFVDRVYIRAGDGGASTVSGILINESDQEYSYVRVRISLYDVTGTVIGNTVAVATDIPPESEWEFEAPIFEDGVIRASVSNIVAY